MNFTSKSALIPIVIGSFILFLGNSSNPPDGNTGAPFDNLCSQCHSGGSFEGNVDIDGLPNSILPNTTYPITITITATSGSPSIGGFQLVAVNASNQNSGNLENTSGETGTTFFNTREYIDQRGGKAFSGGSVSWNFNWTSPNGPNGSVITMYFASNLANGNGNTSGDKIINANKSGTMMGGGTPLSVVITSKKNVSCNGGDNGEATASANGGNPPYSYTWSNGQMGSTATMLSAGNYTVTVTDNSSATATASTTITQPPALLHTLNVVKHVTCFGGKDGEIIATATGGTPPYNFIYSSGSPKNLISGIYSVTVSDANSCTVSSTTVVNEPMQYVVSTIILEHPSCPLDSNGHIQISVSGSNPPYKYLWNSGESTAQIINKKTGLYKVTITDAKFCTTTREYELKSEDFIPPKLIGKNGIVYLNDRGYSLPDVSDYIVEHSDNCDPDPVLTINIDTFTCSHLGKNNYILDSKDAFGNNSKDTIEINVMDTIKPIIHVWQDTLFKRCDILVPMIIATDNCPILEYKKLLGPDEGTVFELGKIVIKYSAEDIAGNVTIDSFITEIQNPIRLTVDTFYFNFCQGDTLFSVLSLSHDLSSPLYMVNVSDTLKILSDSSLIIKTWEIDSLLVSVQEESGCYLEYKMDITYPGPALKLDTVIITNATELVNDGKIEVFIMGADSISIHDASDGSFINNTGLNLGAGEYIVRAYLGSCEFEYGPYTIQQVVASSDIDPILCKVYPNPFNHQLIIESESGLGLTYYLFNAQSQIIQTGNSNSTTILNLDNTASGVYYLKLKGKSNNKVIKLVKL
jgi:hypothetical protein